MSEIRGRCLGKKETENRKEEKGKKRFLSLLEMTDGLTLWKRKNRAEKRYPQAVILKASCALSGNWIGIK